MATSGRTQHANAPSADSAPAAMEADSAPGAFILAAYTPYLATESSMKEWTIGGLARAAGVNIETIRFYQRRGLMPEPRRPAGGVRRYGEEAAQRLRFIKRAQDIGVSLAEVTELLRLQRGCRGAHDLAASTLADAQRPLASLARV